MTIQKMYTYWDVNEQKQIQSFVPVHPNTDLVLYRLIAERGCYLYNTRTKAIKHAITIPYFLKEEWEEKAY